VYQVYTGSANKLSWDSFSLGNMGGGADNLCNFNQLRKKSNNDNNTVMEVKLYFANCLLWIKIIKTVQKSATIMCKMLKELKKNGPIKANQ
jgi:hypothetical protein